jgi:OOP family OmpA-OmpF porin
MKSTNKNFARTSARLSLVTLAVIASCAALADDSAWYIGANVGPSKAVIDNERITNSLMGSGATSVSIVDDDRDRGFKIYGGYQVNKYFSLEGGYFDLGRFGFSATTVPAGTLNGSIKLRGLNLDVVGTVPITERFSAFGRIGANYAQASDNFSGTGAVQVLNPNPTKRDTNLKVGLGVQYAFTDSLAMRAEVERYRINDAVGNKGDVDLVSVGLVYKFGAKTPTPVARSEPPAPAYVAPAPMPIAVAPAPPAPPPPKPPMPAKVTFSSDALFDFDKAGLKPGGQQELDKFASDLRGTSFEVITVTGHTDRIGSHAYNLKLSTRRAETVQNYLVSNAGIPASKIVVKGVDGAEPVTKLEDCPGKKVTPALIACLQPDRRVEVEVSGTR